MNDAEWYFYFCNKFPHPASFKGEDKRITAHMIR